MSTVELQIQGMTCGGCVKAVQNVLGRVPGVEVVDLGIGRAVLRFGSGWDGSVEPVIAAIARAGFTALRGEASAAQPNTTG